MKMANNKKERTQKEIKPAIKAEVDAFITELMEKYPEIARTSLKTYITTEARQAMEEIETYGRVWTNKERRT
jgi:hypothetical protein